MIVEAITPRFLTLKRLSFAYNRLLFDADFEVLEVKNRRESTDNLDEEEMNSALNSARSCGVDYIKGSPDHEASV